MGGFDPWYYEGDADDSWDGVEQYGGGVWDPTANYGDG